MATMWLQEIQKRRLFYGSMVGCCLLCCKDASQKSPGACHGSASVHQMPMMSCRLLSWLFYTPKCHTSFQTYKWLKYYVHQHICMDNPETLSISPDNFKPMNDWRRILSASVFVCHWTIRKLCYKSQQFLTGTGRKSSSSWNMLLGKKRKGRGQGRRSSPCVSYWNLRLRNLSCWTMWRDCWLGVDKVMANWAWCCVSIILMKVSSSQPKGADTLPDLLMPGFSHSWYSYMVTRMNSHFPSHTRVDNKTPAYILCMPISTIL
jgi:hypothetical protein